MAIYRVLTCWLIVVALGVAFTGCGGDSEILSQMSGSWKSNKSEDPIQIKFADKDKSITILGKNIPVEVKSVDKGKSEVTVSATPAAGQVTEWTLRQVWNDNGSQFTIDFDHDGTEERLSKAEQ